MEHVSSAARCTFWQNASQVVLRVFLFYDTCLIIYGEDAISRMRGSLMAGAVMLLIHSLSMLTLRHTRETCLNTSFSFPPHVELLLKLLATACG